MVDLVELISPVGLQNKNAIHIMETFWTYTYTATVNVLFPRLLKVLQRQMELDQR